MHRLAWLGAALLCSYGVFTSNPAAVYLAQAAWASMLLIRSGPLWRWLPAGAVAVVGGYVLVAEVTWLLALLGAAPTVAARRTAVAVLTVAAAAAAAFSIRRGAHGPRHHTQPVTAAVQSAAVAVGVGAATWPAIRPGTLIGTTEFILPAADIVHNMSRAAIVQAFGYIPYGTASPVGAEMGDYYPRAFHVAASSILSALGLDPGVETELWALGFARMYWLLWGLVLVALASWAVSLQESHTGRRLAPLAFAAASTPAVLLLHPVFFSIIVPGFPSFGLALLGTLVALSQLSEDDRIDRTLVVVAVSVVTVSHAWPTLLLIVGAALVARLLHGRHTSGGWIRPSYLIVTVGMLIVSLIARPIGAILLSGDASNQARENGSLAAVPMVLLAAWFLGIVTLVATSGPGRQRLVILSALIGALTLELLALVATGWDWNLYYPRKVVWSMFLLFLPPLAFTAWNLLDFMLLRLRRLRFEVELTAVATGLVAIAVVIRPTTATMLLNRPLLEARIAGLAHEALNRSDVQVVAQRYMTQESDYAVNRWGHAGLELQGVPALNLSDLHVGDLSRKQLCGATTLRRPLLVYTSDDVPSPSLCGAPLAADDSGE